MLRSRSLRVLTALAASIVLSSAAARAAGTETPAQARWRQLTSRGGTPVAATWADGGRALTSAYGVVAGNGDSSERGVRGFLRDNAALLDIAPDTADLALVRVVDSPMGRHFFFEQRVAGLSVESTEVAVHHDRRGRVVALTSNYHPRVAHDSAAAEVALDRAVALLGDTTPEPKANGLEPEAERAARFQAGLPGASGTLVVAVVNGAARLAWRVSVPSDRESWSALVDARSGAILERAHDVNRYVNGSGKVFSVNAVVATHNNNLVDSRDAASAVPATAYSTVTLPGLNGTGYLTGSFASSSATKRPVKSTTNSFLFDRSSIGFSETMGYYYIDLAQRYIQSLGFTTVNNRQQVFAVDKTTADNSFYSPNNKQISYGTGGVDDAEDAEVILHEYGHSIQDNQKPGFGSSKEAGAMGEGFGDYWAGSVGAQLSGAYQDTCIAEWDATSYTSGTPHCLRRLDGTKHYPQDVTNEVHNDGEIWSAALWQIRGALGAARADTLILQHHFLIPANASFNQAANALVTAASNLGYPSSEVGAIRTILTNRGFTVTV